MGYIFLELEIGVASITKANSLLEIAFNSVILQTQSCVLRMKIAAAPSFELFGGTKQVEALWGLHWFRRTLSLS